MCCTSYNPDRTDRIVNLRELVLVVVHFELGFFDCVRADEGGVLAAVEVGARGDQIEWVTLTSLGQCTSFCI